MDWKEVMGWWPYGWMLEACENCHSAHLTLYYTSNGRMARVCGGCLLTEEVKYDEMANRIPASNKVGR